MRYKIIFYLFFCFFALQITIFAQTHMSVPLDNPVYHVIEQAQMRGLCGPLPSVRPYSQAQIIYIINQIIVNNEDRKTGKLNTTELQILTQFKQDFSPSRDGLNLLRGTYSGEHIWNEKYFSYEVGLNLDFTYSGGFYPVAGGYKYIEEEHESIFEGADHPSKGDIFNAFEIGGSFFYNGDLGRNVSYGLTASGRLLKNPRAILGKGLNGYNVEFEREYTIFSEPLAYFPYTYMRRWDSFVYTMGSLSASGMEAWPYNVSGAFTMFPELSGSALSGHVNYRIARIDREWAGMTTNSSLVLNRYAQPFLAAEITLTPFKWLYISSLTGVLEYHNAVGINGNSAAIKDVSKTFQNAFSLSMLEMNLGKYFYIGMGSDVVWVKRFELGYPFPFIENFFYQNNIGDFDNLAVFLNLKGLYPGIGIIWLSFFLDEADFSQDNFLSLDRSMYALQAGTKVIIPWLPLASLKLSYTKIEPYSYTHQRINTPWYGDLPMETNYVNAGKPIGYYLPPNSDEILVRFETMPFVNALFSLQYQMIRHGADYGDRAVDGSSYWSELGKNRSSTPALRKFFLRDGAYQWMHVFKIGGEYSLAGFNWPLKFLMDIGGVYSYFTDIDQGITPNITGKAYQYSVVNTPQYPHSLSFIAAIGIKIFP